MLECMGMRMCRIQLKPLAFFYLSEACNYIQDENSVLLVFFSLLEMRFQ